MLRDEPRDAARHSGRQWTDHAGARRPPAVVEEHIARGRERRDFAIVDRCDTSVSHTYQGEAAAPEVAGFRIHDRQRETDGDCGVHGIAAGLHDLDAGLTRERGV